MLHKDVSLPLSSWHFSVIKTYVHLDLAGKPYLINKILHKMLSYRIALSRCAYGK